MIFGFENALIGLIAPLYFSTWTKFVCAMLLCASLLVPLSFVSTFTHPYWHKLFYVGRIGNGFRFETGSDECTSGKDGAAKYYSHSDDKDVPFLLRAERFIPDHQLK